MSTRDEGEERSVSARFLAGLVENWSLKVISLVVALALYVVLHSGGDQQRTIDVEVNLMMPPGDASKILLTTVPSRVRLTVRGPRTLVEDLAPVDSIDIDFTSEPSTIRFDVLNFKLPPGVHKIAVTPPYLPLRWDSRMTKRVKVEPSTSQPPEGLSLRDLVLSPDTVGISGPKSRVDTVQKIHTVVLDLKDRAVGKHDQKLALDVATDTDPNMVKPDVESVDAHFELVPEAKTRTFLNIPIAVVRGKGVTLRPRSVSVIVTCPPKRADELSADVIVPKLDLEALGPDFAKKGPEDAEVRVEVSGCTEVLASPSRVTVSR
ncbi:MAG: hypothetical protein NVS3B20_23170 [Polyangiales bacterium]